MAAVGFRRFRRRRFGGLAHQLDAHQLCGDDLAQVAEHGLEQFEGLALVFLQRVALAVAAETDDRAEMVEVDDVLAPQRIERLQHHGALDIGHHFRAEPFGALGDRGIDGCGDALANLVLGNAFFLRPLVDRKVGLRTAGPRP